MSHGASRGRETDKKVAIKFVLEGKKEWKISTDIWKNQNGKNYTGI